MREGGKYNYADIPKLTTFQGPHPDSEMIFWWVVEKLSRQQLNDLVECWSVSFARPKSLWVNFPANKLGVIQAATCGYTPLLPPGRLEEDHTQAAVVAATIRGMYRFNQIWGSEEIKVNLK